MKSLFGNRNYWLGFASSIALLIVGYLCVVVLRKGHTPPEGLQTLLRHQKTLDDYVEMIKRASIVPDSKGEYPVSAEVRSLRVTSIWVKDDFVFLLFMSRWPDDAWQAAVYDLKGGTIRTQAILGTYPNRITYHIQYVKDKWYFWKYD